MSQALAKLEKELGFAIFKRTATGVKPTEEGSEFLYHAKNITNQLDAVGRISQRTGNEKLKYRLRWDKLSRSIETVSKDVENLNITSDKITKKFHPSSAACDITPAILPVLPDCILCCFRSCPCQYGF